jgi:predicted RNA-binding Zn ribbon-like protein
MRKVDDLPRAPGEDDHLALALVNSRRNARRGAVDDIADATAVRRWLAERASVSVRVNAGAVQRVADVRTAARELLAAAIERRPPREDAVTALNRAATAAPGAHALVTKGRDVATEWRSLGGDTLDRILAAIAVDAMELATQRRTDLAACEAPDCIRLLVRDHARRRWCSDRCGERVRAARYYARHRPKSGDTAPG